MDQDFSVLACVAGCGDVEGQKSEMEKQQELAGQVGGVVRLV